MRGVLRVWLCWTLFATSACQALGQDWPDRRGRSPEQTLVDLIRWQQQRNVKTSTGTLAYDAFTDADYAAFARENRPGQVVAKLTAAANFTKLASALASLPATQLRATLRSSRKVARPTWATMGFIDRQGRGQTEAGHRADLDLAQAIVDAFARRLGVDPR